MFKFLTDLFAATADKAPGLATRLNLDAMEDRYTPAVLVNPGVVRGFNPQPEPPGRVAVPQAADLAEVQVPGINAVFGINDAPISAGLTRGLIVVGG